MTSKSWKDLSKSLKNVLRGAGSILEIHPTYDREPGLYHTDDAYHTGDKESQSYHTDDAYDKGYASGKGSRLYHPARTDADALRGDWKRVGNDLKRALDRAAYDEEVK